MGAFELPPLEELLDLIDGEIVFRGNPAGLAAERKAVPVLLQFEEHPLR